MGVYKSGASENDGTPRPRFEDGGVRQPAQFFTATEFTYYSCTAPWGSLISLPVLSWEQYDLGRRGIPSSIAPQSRVRCTHKIGVTVARHSRSGMFVTALRRSTLEVHPIFFWGPSHKELHTPPEN